MYDVIDKVQEWRGAGRDVRVAQLVASRGFSSRQPGATIAWTAGANPEDERPVGSLAGIPLAALSSVTGLVEVTISEDEARAAGLACGGVATVLVQDADAFPDDMWPALHDRRPLCLATRIESGSVSTQVFTPETMRSAHAHAHAIPRLFARGTSDAAVFADDAGTTVAIALWPVPTLVVVGDGLIAAALSDMAALLGWQSHVTNLSAGAVAAAGWVQPSDAYVVLSHDRAVDGPALQAALAGRAGYVGALGSRRTQQARGEWLTANGVSADDQARIHGPAGLDIDAHTPGEIAVSITAEILAHRSHSSGGALRDRSGPVHHAGVQAPPPRYAVR